MDHNPQAAAALNRAQGPDQRPVPRGVWLALAAAVRKHPGRAVVSSEMFCEAYPDTARRVVADLGADRVHVVITLRPLELLLPSSWQQHIKAGHLVPYGRWLERILESRDKLPTTPTFWLRQHHPELIRRWADAAGGTDRVSVVITDASRPRGLFDAFEDLLDLPRDTLDPAAAPSNRSLSLAEVELLRWFNRRARRQVSREAYYRLVKRGAVLDLVEQRTPRPREQRLVTPGWAVQRAREYSRSDVAEIAAMQVNVIGDLRLLAPDSPVPDVPATIEPNAVPIGLAASFAAELFTAGLRAGAELRGDPLHGDATTAARPARPARLGIKLDRAVIGARDRLARTQVGARLGDRLRSRSR
jgi:hypothetical protein